MIKIAVKHSGVTIGPRACKACSARGPSAVGGPKFTRRCFLKFFGGKRGPFWNTCTRANCNLVTPLVKQITPYGRQNGHSAQHDVGKLWHVYSIVFQHSTPRMIIHWHLHMTHLLLFFTPESQFHYWFT